MKKVLAIIAIVAIAGGVFAKVQIENKAATEVKQALDGLDVKYSDVSYSMFSNSATIKGIEQEYYIDDGMISDIKVNIEEAVLKGGNLEALTTDKFTKVFDELTLHNGRVEIETLYDGTSVATFDKYYIKDYQHNIFKIYNMYKAANFSEEFAKEVLSVKIALAEATNYTIIAEDVVQNIDNLKTVANADGSKMSSTATGISAVADEFEITIDKVAVNDFAIPNIDRLAKFFAKHINEDISEEQMMMDMIAALDYGMEVPFTDFTFSNAKVYGDTGEDSLTEMFTMGEFGVKLTNVDNTPTSEIFINDVTVSDAVLDEAGVEFTSIINKYGEVSLKGYSKNTQNIATKTITNVASTDILPFFSLNSNTEMVVTSDNFSWFQLVFGSSFESIMVASIDPFATIDDTLISDFDFTYTDKGLLPIGLEIYALMGLAGAAATPEEALAAIQQQLPMLNMFAAELQDTPVLYKAANDTIAGLALMIEKPGSMKFDVDLYEPASVLDMFDFEEYIKNITVTTTQGDKGILELIPATTTQQ